MCMAIFPCSGGGVYNAVSELRPQRGRRGVKFPKLSQSGYRRVPKIVWGSGAKSRKVLLHWCKPCSRRCKPPSHQCKRFFQHFNTRPLALSLTTLLCGPSYGVKNAHLATKRDLLNFREFSVKFLLISVNCLLMAGLSQEMVCYRAVSLFCLQKRFTLNSLGPGMGHQNFGDLT